jgi:hypothetical protein
VSPILRALPARFEPLGDAFEVFRLALLEFALGHERSYAVLSFRADTLRAREIVDGVRFAAPCGGEAVSALRRPTGGLDLAPVLLRSPQAILGLALAGGRVELGRELLGAAGGQHAGQALERIPRRLDRRVLGVWRVGLFGEVEVVRGPAPRQGGVGEFLAQAGVGEQEGGVGGQVRPWATWQVSA